MNKDQRLLEEAYQSIYESVKEPLYFGPEEDKWMWRDWLSQLKHEIHEDGSISVSQSVTLSHYKSAIHERVPFNFRKVGGDFWCTDVSLTSLEGFPKEVEGDFACTGGSFASLKGAPEIVGGDFYCDHNKLTTLEGAPMKIKRVFNCHHNNLTSLKGAPKEVGDNFYCHENKLTSLDGAPEVIGGEFDSDQFTDEQYRNFVRKRKYVDGKLDKEFDIDLEDF
jgi:hypothetical protein